MASTELDCLWKENFRDPLLDYYRISKSREPLWIEHWHDATLGKENLRKQRVQDGDFSIRKATRDDQVPKVHLEFQDRLALLNSIKACIKQKDLLKGSKIHANILQRGLLKTDIILGNALLSMYAKCGALAKAQELFDQLPVRDVVTWNALITGFSQHGLSGEALSCFEQMQDEGLSPDAVTFVSSLKACGSLGAVRKGAAIHAEIGRQRLLEHEIVLGTALVDMYAKCGALAKAQEVFNQLPARNVVTWNALIAGYTQHGNADEALSCFERMQNEGCSPDAVTFLCILKACSKTKSARKGEEIHEEIYKQGLLETNNVLGNAVVDMYAKCGALAKAQAVFDNLPTRDIVSWNVLIDGYSYHGLGEEALDRFGQMRDEGLSPDAVTFVCILKACGSLGAVEKGEEIHSELGSQGLLEKDGVLGNALVDMYAKCGALAKAQGVFDKLPARNLVTWNELIAGYAHHGLGNKALSCFRQMQDEGLTPNAITFSCILKACGSVGAAEKGEEIHAEVSRQGLLEKNIILGNALVDMYAKCGQLAKAQGVCDNLRTRNVVTWNALIAGYAQHDLSDDALRCFQQMQNEGLSADAATFVCILKACGGIGAVEKGEEIHAEVDRQGLLEKDIVLGTALMGMYAKCGILVKAQGVFDTLPVRNLISWNTLIAGYAHMGKVKMVSELFTKLIGQGPEPDAITFLVLLTACSHAGLVKEGQMYFDTMSTVYCIIPTLEHRTCMVDILSRAGHFGKAICMIETVPPSECLVLWSVLMGACGKWVNLELGRWAFERAIQLEEKFDAAYVCISNIISAAGMQDEPYEIDVCERKLDYRRY